MISTGVTLGFSSVRTFCTGTAAATSLNPAWTTEPVRPRSPCPGPATPLPKPALAIVPRAPCAPPVPLPVPGPAGRSNEPSRATVIAPFLSEVPLTPFGSPNPPVWTSCAGFWRVAGAELPEAKDSVTTSFFGFTGVTTSLLVANVPVTTSFFGSGFGGTGSGTFVNCNGSSFGSTFGTSGSGTVIFGGVSLASTFGGGGTIFCTGGFSSVGAYSGVSCVCECSTCGDGSHLNAATNATTPIACNPTLQTNVSLRRAEGNT